VVYDLQSKRLSEAEFVTFARTLGWQSPALAAAFNENTSSSFSANGGHLQIPAGPEHQDAKRQRYAIPDIAATAQALMALNAVNNQVSQWGSFSKLPNLQHLLAHGRPDSSHSSLEGAPRGPAKSTSSTPSPGMSALQPMYSPTDLAQALASLSQAHNAQSQLSALADMRDKSQVPHIKTELGTGAVAKDSSTASSPSTPPSRSEPVDKPAAAPSNSCFTSMNAIQTSAARVVSEGVQKDMEPSGSAAVQWQATQQGTPRALSQGFPLTQASSTGAEDASAHNKYCHFCQHIKVKRASSMIACENRGCNRRFCEHCLNTHVADPVRYETQRERQSRIGIGSGEQAPGRSESRVSKHIMR